MGLYRIAFSEMLGVAQSNFSSGITDLGILGNTADPLLVSTTRPGGGIAIMQANSGDILRVIPVSQDLLQLTPPDIAQLNLGGQTFLVISGLREPGLFALPFTSSGGVGTPLRLTAPGQDLGLITDIVEAPHASGTSYFASIRGTGLLRLDHIGTTQFHAETLSLNGAGIRHTVSDMIRMTQGNEDYLVKAFASADSIASHRVTQSGTLSHTSEVSAGQGMGMDAPTALTAVMVGGINYVIAAGTLSSSLSVFELGSGGLLQPVDHVIDDLNTRFQRVTALDSIAVGDRSFVVAGGGDDGVSLFLLLPGGRLLHQDSFADTMTTALANVSNLTLHHSGQSLQIFAGSERETGITRLTVDLGAIGQTRIGTVNNDALSGGVADDILGGDAGDDTLTGGEGRDILLDGPGVDQMTGGGGADIFILAADGQADVITDFQPGVDKLDLSSWAGLRSASQLRIDPQSWGAIITYQTEVLQVRSASGGMLSRNDVLWATVLPQTSVPLPTLSAAPPADGRITGSGNGDTLNGTAGADIIDGSGGNDRILGMAGSDMVIGGPGNDTLFGGDGQDSLWGGNGNDRLDGDAGNDIIRGEAGRDTLSGGAGQDSLYGGDSDDALFGGAGNDLLLGDAGADAMDGGDGSDTYVVDALDRIVDSGVTGTDIARIAGDQSVNLALHNWSGIEQVEGGGGNDTIDALGYATAIRILGFNGDDVLSGAGGHDWLSGGSGNDRLNGAAGDDTLFGGDGDDTLIGWLGIDVMDGGEGSDQYFVDATDRIMDTGLGGEDRAQIFETVGVRLQLVNWQGIERVNGFTGNDTLDATGSDRGIFLFGERGDDLLIGGDGNDTISGGPGNDRFYGGGGDDLILIADAGDVIGNGGDGFDTVMIDNPNGMRLQFSVLPGIEQVIGGAGADLVDAGNMQQGVRILGGDGADVLIGGSANDWLEGGAWHDRLTGGLGDDTLLGGEGSDTLIGWLGADVMDGGEGSDLFMVDASDRISDSGAWGFDRAQIYQSGGVALRVGDWNGIERVNGFTGNDTIDASGAAFAMSLLGEDGNDLLRGGAGNDTLFGGRGTDLLEGGDGNDFLSGAGDNDTIFGGNGNDTLIGWLGADQMDGGEGSDLYMVDAGDLLRDGGSSGFDRAQIYQETSVRLDLASWRGIERVNGFLGNDTLDASTWTESIFLHGERGNDLLLGGAGNDTVSGGTGHDTLIGGAGNDWLVGDGGMDVFVFRAGFGRDVIARFDQGMDRLDFSGHLEVRGLTDLIITQFRTDTVIRTTTDSPDLLIIASFDSVRLSDGDFIF